MTEKQTSKNQFALEELEARVLLSADGLSAGIGAEDDSSSLVTDAGSVIEFVHEESDFTQSGDDEFDWSGGEAEDLTSPLEAQDIDEGDSGDSEDSNVDEASSDVEGSSDDMGESDAPDTVVMTTISTSEEIEEVTYTSGFDSQDLVVSQLVDTLNAANAPPVIEGNDPISSDFDTYSSQLNGNLVPVSSDDSSSEATFFLDSSSELSGNGLINGNLISDGVLSPGNSPGVFEVAGNLVLNDSGTVVIEIGGVAPSTTSAPSIALEPNPAPPSDDAYDHINVLGALTLGGDLEVNLINGFTPVLGQTFDILNYQSVSGAFNNFIGKHLGNNLMLQPTLGSNSLTLEIVRSDGGVPERPVLFIPGFGGSFAADDSVAAWVTNRGPSPDKLQLDPLGGTYDDLIQTLDAAGFTPDLDLFVANWDWRLSVAPSPSTVVDGDDVDGVISGPDITPAKLVDNEFKYGIDYLGFSLKEASEQWASSHGVVPAGVDILTHSTGGLIARAYIQSVAYQGEYAVGKDLPAVNDLVMIGVPNQGAVSSWNLLQNNWSRELATRFTAVVIGGAYEHVLGGGTITGSDHDIDLAFLQSFGGDQQQVFVDLYVQSLNDLLPTFDFLDDGVSGLSDVNPQNSFLLDLNDGLGLDGVTDANPNQFLTLLAGDLIVYYSDETETESTVLQKTGGQGTIVEIDNPLGRAPQPGEIWFEDVKTVAGDGTALGFSAFNQFIGNNAVKERKQLASSGLDTGHGPLASNFNVQEDILIELGIASSSNAGGLVSTDLLKNDFERVESLVRLGVAALQQTNLSGSLDMTFSGPDFQFDDILEVRNPTFTVDIDFDDSSISGFIQVAATSVALFPGKSFTASFSDEDNNDVSVTGTFSFDTNEFNFTGQEFFIGLGDVFNLRADEFNVVIGGLDQIEVDFVDARLTVLDLLDLRGDFGFKTAPDEVVDLDTNFPSNLAQASGAAPAIEAIAAAGNLTYDEDYATLNGLDVNAYRLTGDGVSGFIGFGDAVFDDITNEIANGDDLTGFGFENLDLGVGIFTPKNTQLSELGLPDFIALKGEVDRMATFGFGEVADIDGREITLGINTAARLSGGVSVPDLSLPDFTLPTLELPDLLLPDLELPSFSLPDLGLPTFDLPEFNITGFQLPSLTLPEFEWPAFDLPALELPDLDLSGLIPDITLPSLNLPAFNLPDLELPNIDLSGLALPDIALPSLALPALQLPDLVIPTINLPEFILPELDLSGLIPKIVFPTIEIGTIELPDIRLPDLDLSAFGLPNLELPNIQLPSFEFPDIVIPEIELPDLPDLDLPSITLPSLALPDLNIPSISLPSLSLPNLDLSGFNLPDLVFPDLSGLVLPSLTLPEIVFPEISIPTLQLPTFDLSVLQIPDFAFPALSLPNITLPALPDFNLQLPNLYVPEFDLGNLSLPSISLPTLQLPEFDLPELVLPDFDITIPHLPTLELPDLSLPSIQLPVLSLPSLDLPDIDLSGLGLPSISLPTISLPSLTLPNLQLPDLELPDLTMPDIQIPDFELPGLTLSGVGKPAIDFTRSFPAEGPDPVGFEVNSFLLDFDGNRRTTVIVDEIDITIADVLDLSGGVAFEFGPTYTVDIATGLPANLGAAANLVQPFFNELVNDAGLTIGENFSTIEGLEVSSITIGASDLDGFLGYGDPDFDSNLSDQDLVGFSLEGVDLGLGLFKSTIPIKKLPKFTALKATADDFTLHGLGDVIELDSQDITLEVNTGTVWPANLGNPVIDFQSSFPADGPTPVGFAVTMPNDLAPILSATE